MNKLKGNCRLRDLCQWKPDATPPSYHELRSLSERLYEDQGVNTQALLGHKSHYMTYKYQDVHRAEWVDVKGSGGNTR